MTDAVPEMKIDPGQADQAVAARLERWSAARVADRLWEKDPTVWFPEPVPELVDRLGWLDLPRVMASRIDELDAFAKEIRSEGFARVVLLGMGGSSLASEVFARTFGSAPGYPTLTVLDSTHPEAVAEVERKIDLERTLFLVCSKSGTTLETLSLFRFFWDRASAASGRAGRRFCAITDPGSPLAETARERGFRRLFEAPADVGGRYSAMSVFGLVPAALIGVQLTALLGRAETMARACRAPRAEENPGLLLGAVLGELVLAGRDKATLLTSPSLESFPAWLEQLVAESTGKDGSGILPVAGESAAPADSYGPDRVFVGLELEEDDPSSLAERLEALREAGHPTARVRLRDRADLAAEIVRWEIGVALAGAVLGIHPFNQPDVQLAKRLAREAMERGEEAAVPEESTDALRVSDPRRLAEALDGWLSDPPPNGYVAIQAFLPPTPETTEALGRIRDRLGGRTGLATTLGLGPRFLHSTGQLHKGGPSNGLFLQLVDEPTADLAVPESDFTFGELIRAQALGDLGAMSKRGRRALRVSVGPDRASGLEIVDRALAVPGAAI